MNRTATPVRPGNCSVGLYELDPMLVIAGLPVRYVTVMTVPRTPMFPAETLVFAADEDGIGDAGFYMEYGAVGEYLGFADTGRALEILGYDAPPVGSVLHR